MGNINELLKLEWEIRALHKQCIARLLGHHGIHFGQPPLLFTLNKLGDCSQIELAKALNVSPASIAVSLRRMEKTGFIQRLPDPHDLRSNRITLTAEGREAAALSEESLRTTCARMFHGFSDQDLAQFMQYYRRMCENLSGYCEQLNETEESI